MPTFLRRVAAVIVSLTIVGLLLWVPLSAFLVSMGSAMGEEAPSRLAYVEAAIVPISIPVLIASACVALCLWLANRLEVQSG